MPVLETLLARSRSSRARIERNMLIDVILSCARRIVLFTLSLSRNVVLDVELPDSVDRNVPQVEMIVLRIADGDTLFWGLDMIRRAELPAKLAHDKANEANPPS